MKVRSNIDAITSDVAAGGAEQGALIQSADPSILDSDSTAVVTQAAADAAAATFGTIPQLADYLVNGYWGGSGHHWGSNTISVNITGLDSLEQSNCTAALANWAAVANITFVFTSGAANITYNHDGNGVAQTTSSDSGLMTSARITISSDWSRGGIGSYMFHTYLHETGHALGLGHQGPYNRTATYGVDNIFTNDTWQWSVMSYFGQSKFGDATTDFVETPQMADIYALQTIYGARTNTRTENTTYGFHSTAGSIFDFAEYPQPPAFTIFDNGGVDTLDCSGYLASQAITLTAGAWSSVGGFVDNIGMYLSTDIENAIGGSGSDAIQGNQGNNVLSGNAGHDSIYGDSGTDTLNGGGGNDTLDGGDGSDTLSGGSGNDIFLVGSGDAVSENLFEGVDIVSTSLAVYTLTANVENLTGISDAAQTLLGSNLDNTIWSGAGPTTIYAYDGNDYVVGSGTPATIVGGNGNDQLYGGSGNDYMVGDAGSDTLAGNGGANSLYGGTGNDYIVAGNGPGSVVDGGAGANTLWGAIGNDYIVGGEGIDFIVGGAGSDYEFGYAGNDSMYGGQGTDYVYGNAGNDFIWTDDAGLPLSQDFIYVGGGTAVDTLADFTFGEIVNHDTVVVSPTSGIASFAQAQAAMQQVGPYTVMSMTGGDQLYFYNVRPSQLTPSNFLFF